MAILVAATKKVLGQSYIHLSENIQQSWRYQRVQRTKFEKTPVKEPVPDAVVSLEM
jgi:hypothetical protein